MNWLTDRVAYNAQRRAEYQAAKEQGERCAKCGAGLQEDDGVMCVECAEQGRRASRKYAAKPDAKKRKREAELERLKNGLCINCKEPRVPGNTTFCKRHLAKHRQHCANWRRKVKLRKKGVALIGKPKPVLAALPKVAPSQYVPLDEIFAKTRSRLLFALARFDWVLASELFDALGVDEDSESLEHYRYAGYLSRAVKSRDVERRGTRNSYEYRLSDRGRELVGHLRNGVVPRETRRAA